MEKKLTTIQRILFWVFIKLLIGVDIYHEDTTLLCVKWGKGRDIFIQYSQFPLNDKIDPDKVETYQKL